MTELARNHCTKLSYIVEESQQFKSIKISKKMSKKAFNFCMTNSSRNTLNLAYIAISHIFTQYDITYSRFVTHFRILKSSKN